MIIKMAAFSTVLRCLGAARAQCLRCWTRTWQFRTIINDSLVMKVMVSTQHCSHVIQSTFLTCQTSHTSYVLGVHNVQWHRFCDSCIYRFHCIKMS